MYAEAIRKSVITEAAAPLALMKSHLRVQHTLDDDLIKQYTRAAIAHIENRTRLSLDLVVYRTILPAFCELIDLNGPTRAIIGVEYRRPGQEERALADESDAMELIDTNRRGKLKSSSNRWPATEPGPDSVVIDYVAGYGDYTIDNNAYPQRFPVLYREPTKSELPLPADLLQAVMVMVGGMYENRESEVVGVTTNELKMGVERMLFSYINPRV